MKKFKKLSAIFFGFLLVTGLAACHPEEYHVDENCIDPIVGEYFVVEEEVEGDQYVGSWWHLSINSSNNSLYLSIFDDEAGNPGIQGDVVSLDQDSIVVKYDPDFYEELPSGLWKVDGDYLKMNYKVTEDGIQLTNHNKTISFIKEPELFSFTGESNSFN